MGKGRDMEKTGKTFSHPGGGGYYSFWLPQISACSYLWLTVIYANYFVCFFPHTPNAQHISLNQASGSLSVCPSFVSGLQTVTKMVAYAS